MASDKPLGAKATATSPTFPVAAWAPVTTWFPLVKPGSVWRNRGIDMIG